MQPQLRLTHLELIFFFSSPFAPAAPVKCLPTPSPTGGERSGAWGQRGLSGPAKCELVLALTVPAWSFSGEGESNRKVSDSSELWKCFGAGFRAGKTPTRLVGSPCSKDFVAWFEASSSGDLME